MVDNIEPFSDRVGFARGEKEQKIAFRRYHFSDLHKVKSK